MGGVFVIGKDDKLVEMREHPYDSEEVLQGLLAKYPNILAGDQVDSISPRRWLLVTREMGLPGEPDGGERWSVDHLLLDQDGIPTLVEVKRSSDTRIRREVVGQLLEYAANAILYWPVERIKAAYESNCERGGLDPDATLDEHLGPDGEPDAFWGNVKTNLQAGRVRLVFVADEIPMELRRIVEFLGEQMDPAEILAVEVKQYVGGGLRTLVPRVIPGRVDGPKSPTRWDPSRFLRELTHRHGQAVANAAASILDWLGEQRVDVVWGKGVTDGSFIPSVSHNGVKHQLFATWTRAGKISLYFQYYKAPFDSEERRLALLERLNAIKGVSLPRDAIDALPSFPLQLLTEKDNLRRFLDAVDWLIREIRAS